MLEQQSDLLWKCEMSVNPRENTQHSVSKIDTMGCHSPHNNFADSRSQTIHEFITEFKSFDSIIVIINYECRRGLPACGAVTIAMIRIQLPLIKTFIIYLLSINFAMRKSQVIKSNCDIASDTIESHQLCIANEFGMNGFTLFGFMLDS